MKRLEIEVSLLKQFIFGLIIRHFGSMEIFNEEFKIIAPRVLDIPRTGNPIITIKQLTDEINQVVSDGDWVYHIAAMWKIINDLEMS